MKNKIGFPKKERKNRKTKKERLNLFMRRFQTKKRK